MEIKLQGTALPCVAQEAIVAGLAVKLTPALGKTYPNVTQGAVLPKADNDATAKYVAAFAVTNQQPPFYVGLTSAEEAGNTTGQPYLLRGFTQGQENLPQSVSLDMLYSRYKEEATIPSGSLMLAYDEGIYEVTSGCIFGSTFNVGDPISAKAGGKWYNSSAGQVGVVWEYFPNTSAQAHRLVVKTSQ